MSKTAFHRQITAQERLHEKRAFELSKETLEQYEVAYSLCEEILYDIEEYIDMRGDYDRRAINIILFRIMGTMQSVKALFLKGYYYDASILIRSFMESLGTCCYISQNKSGEKWLANKKLGYASDMVKAIPKTLKRQIPEKETGNFYQQLSKYVHGNSLAIQTLISGIEDEYDFEDQLYTVRFKNPSSYDKGTVDSIVWLPLLTSAVIQELFPEISDYDKKQIEEIQNACVDTWKKLNPNL